MFGYNYERQRLTSVGRKNADCNNEIKKAILQGMPQAAINAYMKKPGLSCFQLREIRIGWLSPKSRDGVHLMADNRLNIQQLKQIRFGFEDGLTLEQVEKYAKFYNEWRWMKQARLCFRLNNILHSPFITKSINEGYDWWTLREIYRIFLFSPASAETFCELFDPEFNGYQLAEIRLGLEHGLFLDEVRSYSDVSYSAKRMSFLRRAYEHGFGEEASVFCFECEDIEKLWSDNVGLFDDSALISGFLNGLSTDQLAMLMHKKVAKSHLSEAVELLINGSDWQAVDNLAEEDSKEQCGNFNERGEDK